MAKATGFTRRNEGTKTNEGFFVFVSVSSFLRVNPFPSSPPKSRNGFTFIELMVVTTILLVLASVVLPLARVTIQRQREAELHRVLREMRTAIDKYKDAVDNGLIGSVDDEVILNQVVCSEAEEIHVRCQEIAGLSCGRSFNHDADGNAGLIGLPPQVEFPPNLGKDFPCSIEIIDG